MAFSTGPGPSRRRADVPVMSEINVTPFVDVMLVLLIVFMVSAPLLTVGVPVDLPQAQAKNLADDQQPLVVTITPNNKIYIQESTVQMNQLVPRLQAITKNNMEARIYIRGDRQLNYGRVMEIMGAINTAGFTKVALLAELPSAPKKQRV